MEKLNKEESPTEKDMIIDGSILDSLCTDPPIENVPNQKLALLIGISNYHSIDLNSEWSDIHGAEDVKILASTLQAQNFRIRTLLDDKATAKGIRKAVQELIEKASQGDLVYLHFSMHGQPFEDLDGDERIYDKEDLWDESIVPVDAKAIFAKNDYEGENHILDDEINLWTNLFREKLGPKGHLYIALDACHAGRSSKAPETFARGTKRGFSPNDLIFRSKKQQVNHYVIKSDSCLSPVTFMEACTATQVNTEIKRDSSYYGPMSYYINEELKKHPMGTGRAWTYRVLRAMRNDSSLSQTMVIEAGN